MTNKRGRFLGGSELWKTGCFSEFMCIFEEVEIPKRKKSVHIYRDYRSVFTHVDFISSLVQLTISFINLF